MPQLTIQPLNFSAQHPADDWAQLITKAKAADAAGVDRIVLSDHVAFGESLDAYGDPKAGGTAGGKQPTGPDGHWLEPLTALAFLAGQTSNVRLGTAILLAALRRPAVLAKTAATLDVLSGGRLDLGVGVGWQAAEYEVAGLSFADRGRLLDETLDVCQALWTATAATYASPTNPDFSFADIHAMPKPVSEGGVPIWVSGTVNQRAMKRLATYGAGWIPWGPAVADPVGGIAAMRESVASFGRDPSTIEVTAYIPTVRVDADDPTSAVDFAATMQRAPSMAEAGVTDFKVTLPIPAELGEATDYLGGAVEAFRSVWNG